MGQIVSFFPMSSGGTELNFSVVAYASEDLLPATAAENTIAVITENEITSWIFDFVQPETPTEGMVWILNGTSSVVDFNALKNNDLQVYPLAASQYISGAWIAVVAKSYHHGAWADWWNGYLFDNGNQFEVITGGWEQQPYSNLGTVTIGDAIVYSSEPNDSGKQAWAQTINFIALDDFKTLYFTVSKVVNTAAVVRVVRDGDNTIVAETSISTVGTGSLDVSSLYGLYRIAVGGSNGRAGTIIKVWLER